MDSGGRGTGDSENPERDVEKDAEKSADAAAREDPGDEIRLQRNEEELETEVRLREAGAVRLRKTVHTDHEEFRVPRRREEVEIERLPVEPGEAPEAPEGTELGREETVMRVYEEEIVVHKRLVLKEEIRLRKEVVEEEETVEADVRREEVEIQDGTERGVRRDK
ncbi:YsnF/AvaK domain-containing protein [Rubrobacter aplysinae]|uniref:YsnF/AvaK domain-containing protein n=1 Tax=Rubrobacter aplysinae TaxID=909625 RepID=UPI00069D3A19|nr:DUF2382 domain-containing protein [Rubrobacter aplysinae]